LKYFHAILSLWKKRFQMCIALRPPYPCQRNLGCGLTMQLVRSIFLSAIHLGTKACQAHHLLEFLKEYSSEHVFLLGDIIDLWSMSRGGVHWAAAQNTFVQKMLRRARHGEKVIFIPGNHDEAMREYVVTLFGNILMDHEYIHTAADGRR
jgi:UDP-2,3-diacylglucosamine pyrophosphatase LpxH